MVDFIIELHDLLSKNPVSIATLAVVMLSFLLIYWETKAY